ncbi:hypothetical protein [Endozoicomonas sp. 4G]|uniref:hypothetical protein n=1 Tax=Endozoicomonas sp. 4G TaxID=2872754 RepID=UPI0020791956|nr:hypothetical protein [Endozoicomonas sp. 4G]
MNTKIFLVFVITLMTSACSNQMVYETVQHDQKLECVKLPPSQQQECFDAHDESFEEYSREREEILDQKN